MRLHGQLLPSPDHGSQPLRAWAADADNEDRLTPVELRVQGNRIVIVPALDAGQEDVNTDVPPDGKQPIPQERAVPLQGDDFALRPGADHGSPPKAPDSDPPSPPRATREPTLPPEATPPAG